MLTLGRADTKILSDGWTVVTKDRKASAHYEHTVAVTRDGADVLTDGR
jgi:methionyl aminopeptidase